MNERDTDTFARFGRRMALIEAEIKNPPRLDVSQIDRYAVRKPASRRAPALAGVALVVAVVVVASLIADRRPAPSATVPAGAGDSSGVPAATASSVPSVAALVPLDPASSPEEPTGPCLSHTTVYDRLRTTIEQEANMSSAVLVGTVSAIGKAQWNTEDGRMPSSEQLEPSQVMRLVRVGVEIVVTGTATGIITVQIPGGLIGCHGFYVGLFAEPKVGSRYLMFLGNVDAGSTEGVVGAREVWAIEGDMVSTAFDGFLPLATVIERARGD